MSARLEQLTASASCWTTDVLQHTTEALNEIASLAHREEKPLVRRGPASEEARTAFQQWLDQSRVDAKVRVQHVGESGHGLVAKDELKKGDVFISIPYDLVLSADVESLVDLAERLRWQEVAQDPLLSRFPSCTLALRLLAEACAVDTKRSSLFKPYIEVLPSTFDIPLYYDVSDFGALDGTELFEPAVKLLYNSIKQFFYLRRLRTQRWSKCPIPMEKFTLGNYFWALGCVLTRQNQVSLRDDHPPTLALIPGWDMCNHEPGDHITTYQDTTARVIACQAQRDFRTGEQVTMFYGPRSNQDLLLYSGFVVEQNTHSLATVALPLDLADPLLKIRRMLLQKEVDKDKTLVVAEDQVLVTLAGDRFASTAMLRAVQLACLQKENVSKALRASGDNRDSSFEWNSDERAAAMTRFKDACIAAEEQYNTNAAKVSKAKRGGLFQRYFSTQASVVASARQSEEMMGSIP